MATMMDRAASAAPKQAGTPFEPKDPMPHVPEDQHDAVARVVAAGMKLAYSAEMADEREAMLSSKDPIPKRLADNVTGLMLTLDSKSKGGIPQGAIFAAAVVLDNEAANMLVQAGQNVTQEDYNESLQILYVQIGKKLGASDDELMNGATNALQRTPEDTPIEDPQVAAPPAEVPADPMMPPGGAMPPGMPERSV